MRCVRVGLGSGRRVVGYLNGAKVLANLGYRAFFDEELFDNAVIGTGDLDASLVALDFAQRLEGLYGGGRLYVPGSPGSARVREMNAGLVSGHDETHHLMTSTSVIPSPMSASLKRLRA